MTLRGSCNCTQCRRHCRCWCWGCCSCRRCCNIRSQQGVADLNGSTRCRSHEFQFLKIMKTAECEMKSTTTKYEKRKTNKAPRTRPRPRPHPGPGSGPGRMWRWLPAARVHLPHQVPHGSVTWNVLLMDFTHSHWQSSRILLQTF